MNQLSKRLAKLEGNAGSAVSVLILTIPSAGGDFNLVKDAAGNRCARRADEGEDQFLERARIELLVAQGPFNAGITALWALRDEDEERLADKHAAQLGAGHVPLRPSVNRADWLRLHGLDPQQLDA